MNKYYLDVCGYNIELVPNSRQNYVENTTFYYFSESELRSALDKLDRYREEHKNGKSKSKVNKRLKFIEFIKNTYECVKQEYYAFIGDRIMLFDLRKKHITDKDINKIIIDNNFSIIDAGFINELRNNKLTYLIMIVKEISEHTIDKSLRFNMRNGHQSVSGKYFGAVYVYDTLVNNDPKSPEKIALGAYEWYQMQLFRLNENLYSAVNKNYDRKEKMVDSVDLLCDVFKFPDGIGFKDKQAKAKFICDNFKMDKWFTDIFYSDKLCLLFNKQIKVTEIEKIYHNLKFLTSNGKVIKLTDQWNNLVIPVKIVGNVVKERVTVDFIMKGNAI